MNVDLYTATGAKRGTLPLPPSLFEAAVNTGLMHQAVVMQRSNARAPIAHAKGRSEVEGSTRKLYSQKHTGRARRGSVRSPLLRGGGKAFGPHRNANFRKDMPKAMRRAALLSCLSVRAKEGAILGLEEYPDTIKTKDAVALLRKLPVELGRRILIVMPGAQKGLIFSMRNIPGVKTLLASYLNPVDVLGARHIVFLAEALKKAEELWGDNRGSRGDRGETKRREPRQPRPRRSPPARASRAEKGATSS